ncbi:MAG: tetratricopeptide repeat protein, partial [Myxococcota bacterium]
FAQASLTRAGAPPRLSAAFALDQATRLYRSGRLADAVAAEERARRQVERLPHAPLLRARLHSIRGAIDVARGALADGLAAHETAEAILVAERGEDHPSRVFELANAANALLRMGRLDDAEARLRTARDLHLRSGSQRAEIDAELTNNLAMVIAQRGDVEAAMVERRGALDRLLEAHGDTHPSVPILRGNLGLDLSRLGRHDEALAEHRRALRARELRLGEEHVGNAYSWQGIGDALAGLSRHAEAVGAYERALALRAGPDTDAFEVAESEASLGRALLAADPEGDRAVALLRAAQARLTGIEQPDAVELRRAVDELLADHSTQL